VLKILIKKEFVEFASSLFNSSRNRKKKRRFGTAGAVVLFAVIMVAVSCGLYVFSDIFASGLLAASEGQADWFYFAILGLLALTFGVFGSIFNTMSAIYKAKDNELLLSLPIEPWKILFARITGVYFMSLIFTAMLWIPTSIKYWTTRSFPLSSVVLCILLTFVIALVVTVISCVLGWIVASVSGRLQNRSAITVIISLVFFGIYYFFIFRLNSIVSSLAANADRISTTMKAKVFPIYHLGRAAAGNVTSFVIFAAIAAVLFAICMLVLSRSFIAITTRNKGMKKVEYKEKPLRERTLNRTLLTRELLHFTKSSTYMLNCGLGLVMLPAVAVIALIYRRVITDALTGITADEVWIRSFIYVAVTAFTCLILAMNVVTAPSISIEGRNIWILQSIPARAADILHAKIKMQIVLDIIPGLFGIIVFGFLSGADPLTLILMAVTVVLFIPFDAAFGLRLNLKRPNFDWKSENVPIKQGMPVFIALFAGWGICIGPALLYFFISPFFPPAAYLAICSAVLLVICLLQERWIRGKGTRLFEDLG